MSWEWVFYWWESYGQQVGGQLRIAVAELDDGRLVGIAPMYLCRASYFGVITSRCLMPIGTTWRKGGAVVSEYLDFIVDINIQPEDVIDELLHFFCSTSCWDEFIIAYLDESSPLRGATKDFSEANGMYFQTCEESVGYSMNLSTGFDAFVTSIGPSARRSFVTRRSKLDAHGDVQYRVTSSNRLSTVFDRMARFQYSRFGCAAYNSIDREFFSKLSAASDCRIRLQMSELVIADSIESVVFDVRVQDEVYNLQIGFNENMNINASLGLLHLGFAAEQHAEGGALRYDLLAGGGKRNDNYKEKITNQKTRFTTVRVIRNNVLKFLYGMWRMSR